MRRQVSATGWHYQHGPIDCLLHAEGEAAAVQAAFASAWSRFGNVLVDLTGELAELRADLAQAHGGSCAVRGAVARRMVAACLPHAAAGRFITAMAAVAGSVAEELVACFDDPRIDRAWVNNGGDIALQLRPGHAVDVGTVADLLRAYAGRAPEGRFSVDAGSPVRGIATSGWRGRSFSLGIADAVTVLARTASVADAAATVIGNAVDIDSPAVRRRPASSVRDDSDLGDRLVTVAVAPLSADEVETALGSGVREAEAQIAAGRVVAAVLQLQGRVRVCGTIAVSHPSLAAPVEASTC